MSLFGSIMDKIVHYAEVAVGIAAPPAAASTTPSTDATPSPVSSPGGPAPSGMPTPAPATPSLGSIDIGAVLAKRAAEKGEPLNWQTSIVDLLKTLDLDSSLSARKQLAQELDVHAGADGSAEENTALHQAVVAKLEANGGNVPSSMKG